MQTCVSKTIIYTPDLPFDIHLLSDTSAEEEKTRGHIKPNKWLTTEYNLVLIMLKKW